MVGREFLSSFLPPQLPVKGCFELFVRQLVHGRLMVWTVSVWHLVEARLERGGGWRPVFDGQLLVRGAAADGDRRLVDTEAAPGHEGRVGRGRRLARHELLLQKIGLRFGMVLVGLKIIRQLCQSR